MAPDFPWLAIVVIVAAVGWFVPKALTVARQALGWTAKVFAEAAADAIAERLGPRLAPSWLADFDEALEPVYQEIAAIHDELNGREGR